MRVATSAPGEPLDGSHSLARLSRVVAGECRFILQTCPEAAVFQLKRDERLGGTVREQLCSAYWFFTRAEHALRCGDVEDSKRSLRSALTILMLAGKCSIAAIEEIESHVWGA